VTLGGAPVTWELLVEENAREVLGRLWLAEVTRAARSVVRDYPPRLYAQAPSWDAAALDDLVQDVVVDRLLREGQLAYIVTTARDAGAARRLLLLQVRWTLSRRRVRTVSDNLLERCREMLARDPFIADTATGSWALGSGARRDAWEPEILDACRRVARVPRSDASSGDRAPSVFSSEQLAQVLNHVADSCPQGFTQRDLSNIFGRVLTHHLPDSLYSSAGAGREVGQFTPEEVLMIDDTVSRSHAALDAEQRLLLQMKMINSSDAEVGQRIGVTRQTAAKRHDRAAAEVRAAFAGMPAHLLDAVVDRFGQTLLDGTRTQERIHD